MRIARSVELPGSPTDIYDSLLDLDAVAPCLPGATLGPAVAGSDRRSAGVVVRFGPMRFDYAGEVRIVSSDPAAHEAVMEAEGKETGGAGTARAVITMAVSETESPGVSRLALDSEIDIQGKAAQFGHGLIEEVAEEVLEEFTEKLTAQLAPVSGAATGTTPQPETAAAPAHVNGAALLWRVFRRRLARLFRGGAVGNPGK